MQNPGSTLFSITLRTNTLFQIKILIQRLRTGLLEDAPLALFGLEIPAAWSSPTESKQNYPNRLKGFSLI